MQLDQVRLLVLQAAQIIDYGGPKIAKKEVSHSLYQHLKIRAPA